VSGGVLAVVPGKLGIGVFSPGLDAYGNSIRGTAVCEEISKRLGLHVFADHREDALLGPNAIALRGTFLAYHFPRGCIVRGGLARSVL
jgi:hypothetical protein